MDNNEVNVNRWVEDQLAALRPDDEWQPDTMRALSRLNQRRVPGSIQRRRWTWAAAGAIVACFSLFALLEQRALAQRVWLRCVEACEGLFVDSPGVVRVSGAAPDFALTDGAGASIRLSAYKGKVVLLNFWATWCPPCRTEMPWFTEFERTYADQGFAVVGVAMDGVWPDIKSVWVDLSKINYPIAGGNEDMAKLYGVNSLPMTVLIDRQGTIAAMHVGIVARTDYEKEIAGLLGK